MRGRVMRLLLHVCCAPDVTVALERLPETERFCLYFDNPNIHPAEEYARRLAAFYQVICNSGVDCVVGGYDPEFWHEHVKDHEEDEEGGERCSECIAYRLERTAKKAKLREFDTIGCVFSTSPHKNAELINRIGKEIAQKHSLDFLESNFKKKEGFKRSVEISRQLGIYRQNYCGCIHSSKQ
ncbi:hypothetical protein CEE37_11500 [candidate division LCP-89 bacterium B3_LCP]|uniref:Epoxyqueuosine reductase QueH n=1 Tax=candidate division LCP-89 bacterium B3_LCP TaxID=2012998 RepID=A0A532UVW8_UNCL8|nr:MAG: hypothetical protein CEE37_11500 [candidate division LCP-89 bacterium B3_LCP]